MHQFRPKMPQRYTNLFVRVMLFVLSLVSHLPRIASTAVAHAQLAFSPVAKSAAITVIRVNLVQLLVGGATARGSHIADCVFNTSILNAVICPLCHQHCGGSHRPRRSLPPSLSLPRRARLTSSSNLIRTRRTI